MLSTRTLNTVVFATLILLSGCSKQIKKPDDTSDPSASIAWLESALPSAAHARDGFEHARALADAWPNDPAVAAFMRANQERLAAIPSETLADAVTTRDFDAFEWSLNQGAELGTAQLRRVWEMGAQWRALALERSEHALPVFMSQAARNMNSSYFEEHIAAFQATGFQLAPDMTPKEYQLDYIRLLGLELERAMKASDTDRMKILLDRAPGLDQIVAARGVDRVRVRAFADHVLYDTKNAALIMKLVELGYPFEGLDMDKLDAHSPLIKSMMAHPSRAISMLGLDRPRRAPLTRSEARFLIKLPIEKLENLHPEHIETAIEMCMAAGGTQQAIEFVRLQATHAPLERADYLRLMSWAIEYNDQKILQLAQQHGGDIRVDELDLNAFADQQTIFERHAPAFMKKIHATMDLTTPEGGLTYGKIRQILAHKNEQAGLFLLKKLDIEDSSWSAVSGGRTLLMDACLAGNLEAVKYLVEKRRYNVRETTSFSEEQTTLFGSSSAREGKMSAMHYAAQGGAARVINYLASRRADVNCETYYGATPLMLAAGAGHLEAVKTLIRLGANVNAQMKSEHKDRIAEAGMDYDELCTATARAKAQGHQEVLAALRAAGARR